MSSETLTILSDDPGNPVFADVVRDLLKAGDVASALSTCLKGVSFNPSFHEGRLLLAKIFFDMGCIPFALRELEELKVALPDNKVIPRLIQKIDPERKFPSPGTNHNEPESEVKTESQTKPASTTNTVAAVEFSFDDLDLLQEDQKN